MSNRYGTVYLTNKIESFQYIFPAVTLSPILFKLQVSSLNPEEVTPIPQYWLWTESNHIAFVHLKLSIQPISYDSPFD